MNTVDNQLLFVLRASNISKYWQSNAGLGKNFQDCGLDSDSVGLNQAELINSCFVESGLGWNLLSSNNLEGFDLSNANLSLGMLRGANLRGANLCLAILRNTDLQDADLEGAILSGCILQGANLRQANLSNTYMLGSNLSHADLSGADLSDAHLLGANLSDANFNNVKVDNARFGWNTGISKEMKFELQLQGAIFED